MRNPLGGRRNAATDSQPVSSCEPQSTSLSVPLLDAVSPYGLALISYLFFLFACFIPPSTYRQYVREPDFLFMDAPTICFYTLCVVAFIAGTRLTNWMLPFGQRRREILPKSSPTVFLLIPIVLGIAATIVTDVYLAVQYPAVMVSLLAQQGAQAKEAVSSEIDGHFALVPLALVGILWWALWRFPELNITGWRKRVVNFFIALGVLSLLASSLIAVDRNMMSLAIGGMAISYLAHQTVKKQLNLRFFLRCLTLFLTIMLALFFGFSWLRGIGGADDQLSLIFGYTVASYNRLAAIVNGNLHYPFAGRGIYLSSLAAHNHYLLSYYLGSPEATDVWASEFGAVGRAGLDSGLIWSGAFGYIYSDLGWFSAVFLFGYGLLYAVGWNWIKRGRVLGIVLYPWFAFCALFWFGFNYLLDRPIEAFVLVALVLTAYEFLFARPSDVQA